MCIAVVFQSWQQCSKEGSSRLGDCHVNGLTFLPTHTIDGRATCMIGALSTSKLIVIIGSEAVKCTFMYHHFCPSSLDRSAGYRSKIWPAILTTLHFSIQVLEIPAKLNHMFHSGKLFALECRCSSREIDLSCLSSTCQSLGACLSIEVM